MLHLILGGARSGKSHHAQILAQASGQPVVYLATARRDPNDAEMVVRIARHQADRPAHWQTIECGTDLLANLQAQDVAGQVLLVDCLTLWLSQCLWTPQHERQWSAWRTHRDALLAWLSQAQATLLMVSNEVGWGVMPDNAVARVFADEQGWLNQAIAAQAQRVTLMAAGLPITVK